jgi:internalin A
VYRSVISLTWLRRLVLWVRDVMVLDELAGLGELDSLSLHRLSHGHDLDFLSAMEGLRSLTLSDDPRIDADRLRSLRGLRHFTLVRVRDLPDLSGIAEASPGLEALQVVNCERLDDLAPLAALVRLRDVNLSDTKGFRSLAPLAGLSGIDELNLLNTEVDDVSSLSTLRALRTLNLAGCENVRDLTPLAALTNLARLDVRGIPHPLDLAPLGGLPDLRIIARTGQELRNVDRLGSLRRVAWDKGRHRIGGYYTAY